MKRTIGKFARFIRNKRNKAQFAVRIQTAVGQMSFSFVTLDEARKFSCGTHAIFALFEPKQSSAEIQQMTAEEIRRAYS
ncbi:MAG: hypothetical protein EBU84_02960 [Actinobacteria bacterium]|nr:hypothetical protein [Actinomycetota bacterium]